MNCPQCGSDNHICVPKPKNQTYTPLMNKIMGVLRNINMYGTLSGTNEYQIKEIIARFDNGER